MALNASNSNNLEQSALKGLIMNVVESTIRMITFSQLVLFFRHSAMHDSPVVYVMLRLLVFLVRTPLFVTYLWMHCFNVFLHTARASRVLAHGLNAQFSSDTQAVWFKLMVTVTEIKIKSVNCNCNCNWNTCNGNIQLMPSWSTIRPLTFYYVYQYVDRNCGLRKIAF